MGGAAAITVRRQILEVEVNGGSEAEGLALQRRLPGVCADVMSPALESAFAPGDPGDAHLLIERLTIEVSGISLDRLEAELADAVRREVGDYLRRHPAVSLGSAETGERGDVRRRTEAESVEDALVVFLRSGRLPWSFRVPPGSRLETLVVEAWRAGGVDASPPPAVRARLAELLALPSVRARLLMQFTPAFVATVLRGIAPRLAAATTAILDVLDAAPSPARALFTRQLWDAALVATARGVQPAPNELVLTAWRDVERAGLTRDDRTLAAALERQWPGVIADREQLRGRDDIKAPPASRRPDARTCNARRGGGGTPRRQRGDRAPASLPAALLRRPRGGRGRSADRPRTAQCVCSTTSPPVS